MRDRRRYYRVHLMVYDAVNILAWRLPIRAPDPSPTPIICLPRKQVRRLHKIHLVQGSTIAARLLNIEV